MRSERDAEVQRHVVGQSNDVVRRIGRLRGAHRIGHRVRVQIVNAQIPDARRQRNGRGNGRDQDLLGRCVRVRTEIIVFAGNGPRQRVRHRQSAAHHQIHVPVLRTQIETDRSRVGGNVELVVINRVGDRDRARVTNRVGQREDGNQIRVGLVERDADGECVRLARIHVPHAQIVALARLQVGRQSVRRQQKRFASARAVVVKHHVSRQRSGGQRVLVEEQFQIAGPGQDVGGQRGPPRHIDDEIPDLAAGDDICHGHAVGVVNRRDVGRGRNERQRNRRRIGVGEDESQLPTQQFRRRIDERTHAIVPDLQPPGAQSRFTNQPLEGFFRQIIVARSQFAQLERVELHLRLMSHQAKGRTLLRGAKADKVGLPAPPIQ